MSASRSLLSLGLACLGLWAPSARAHAPHDVVHLVALSPDFAQDGVVMIHANLLDHRIVGWSDDRGDSWRQVGGPVALHVIEAFAFSPDYAHDQLVFAATSKNGVWRSEDGGLHFTASGAGLPPGPVSDVAVSPAFAVDGVVLAATSAGVFRSSDRGLSWQPALSGLVDIDIKAVAMGSSASAPVAFAAGDTVHRSDDGGLTWVPQQLLESRATSLDMSPGFETDGSVIVGTVVDGTRVTGDGGAFWRPASLGLSDLLVTDVELAADGTRMVTTRTDGVFTSPNLLGAYALDMSDFEPPDPSGSPHYRAVAQSPTFAADGVAYVAAFEGLWRTEDRGQSWKQLDVFHQLVEMRLEASSRYVEDGLVYVGTYGGGVKVWHEPRLAGDASPPPGRWPSASSAAQASGPAPGPMPIVTGSGAPSPALGWWEARAGGLISKWCDCVDVSPDPLDDQAMFYGYWGGFRSLDGGRTWSKLELPLQVEVVREVAMSPAYASDRTVFIGTNSTGVWRSTDGGDSWQEMVGLPPSMRTRRIRLSPGFATDGTLFVASWDDRIWRSTDFGASWHPAQAGITDVNVRGFALSPAFTADGVALAGTRNEGIFRTEDGGESWTPVNAGLPGDGPWAVDAVAFSPEFADDGIVFCCTMAGELLRSDDGGHSWTDSGAGLPNSALRDLLVSPDFARDRTLFVASHDGVWRSRDGGASWHALPRFVRVDETHPVVVADGSWTANGGAGANGGGLASTTTAGASCELRFLGQQVAWYARPDPLSAVATVFVDGRLVSQVDLYAPTEQPLQAVFQQAFEEAGWHTIRIEHSGTANGASGGSTLTHDGWSHQR